MNTIPSAITDRNWRPCGRAVGVKTTVETAEGRLTEVDDAPTSLSSSTLSSSLAATATGGGRTTTTVRRRAEDEDDDEEEEAVGVRAQQRV